MGSRWSLLILIVSYVILLVAFVVTGVADLREHRRHLSRLRRNKHFDFEKFCREIPAGDRLVDPYVLVNRRWIRKNSLPED